MRAEYKRQLEADRSIYGENAAMYTTTVRVPKIYVAKFQIYSAVEGDNVSGLHREGMIRVLNDREQSPDYLDALPESAKASLRKLTVDNEEHLAALEDRLAIIRALHQD